MTTIVWHGKTKTLAADKRANSESGNFTVTKIWRLADGRLVGAAGLAAQCVLWKEWLESGKSELPTLLGPGKDASGWYGIVIVPDGTIILHSKNGVSYVEDEYFAIGSGKPFAVAAMAMGADATKAVEIASMFDSGTGHGIDVLELLPQV